MSCIPWLSRVFTCTTQNIKRTFGQELMLTLRKEKLIGRKCRKYKPFLPIIFSFCWIKFTYLKL